MNIKFSYGMFVLVIVTLVSVSCANDESIVPNCEIPMYYVSSAVCSGSNVAAALRDDAGEIYIARNFFNYIRKEDVTVDLPIVANFELTGEPMDRSQCGLLVVGSEIILSCFSLTE